MSFVSSKPDPYPTPVDVVVYLISAIMNRVIKRFYCIIIEPSTTIRLSWKTAVAILITTLSLMVLQMDQRCNATLLMIGGVELNPGPCSEDIIAALSAESPSDEIRNCIRMYDPNKTMTEIKKALNKAAATMTYLGVPGQKAYVKPAVINSLVCRIENLLPDHCPVSSDTYVISKDEMSLLNCSICGQAAHTQCLLDLLEIPQDKRDTLGPDDITKRINPHSVPGIIYIYVWSVKNRQSLLKKMARKGKISRNLIEHNLSQLGPHPKNRSF